MQQFNMQKLNIVLVWAPCFPIPHSPSQVFTAPSFETLPRAETPPNPRLRRNRHFVTRRDSAESETAPQSALCHTPRLRQIRDCAAIDTL